MAVIVEVRLYMTLAYIGTTELKRKIKEIIRDITYTVNKQRPKLNSDLPGKSQEIVK